VRLKKVFETNIIGSFIACREAIKRMSTKYGGSGGVIVNLYSAAERLWSPTEFIDYAASKGAIDTMTIGLAKEVAMEGIRVNAIRPGLILTGKHLLLVIFRFQANSFGVCSDIHASAGAPDRVERLVGAVPMQRAGTADEVAESILWLLSDKASYVTGSNLDVSGGR
jgi:NAD(P)-dependent dehydrogenase (short-subunit alcohol dehydrogenase family)